MVSNFPPSSYEDILVEYLEVCAPKEQEKLQSKDLLDVSFKSEGSTCDSDSGRGSCDSHTLLTDKCGEANEEKKEKDQRRAEMGAQRQADWTGGVLASSHQSVISPVISSGRVKTWPSVFSSSPQKASDLLEQQRSLVMARQHYPSDNLFPPASAPSYVTHPSHGTLSPEFTTNKQPCGLHPQTLACRQLQSHSDVDISCVGVKRAPVGPATPALGPADHSHAQRVNGELLLQTVTPGGADGCPQMGRYYSKVKCVDGRNMLLLQREDSEECSNQQQETDGVKGGCSTYSTVTVTKNPASAITEEIILTTSGYVDTATVCMLPSC